MLGQQLPDLRDSLLAVAKRNPCTRRAVQQHRAETDSLPRRRLAGPQCICRDTRREWL